MITVFDNYGYVSHVKNIDAFLYVRSTQVLHDGRVLLQAYWMIQGTANYWYGSECTSIMIEADDVKFWREYIPRGTLRY